nr:retrotransposon protein, putative, Ty1-copia subclass [Tanacetum cinerariifolium]
MCYFEDHLHKDCQKRNKKKSIGFVKKNARQGSDMHLRYDNGDLLMAVSEERSSIGGVVLLGDKRACTIMGIWKGYTVKLLNGKVKVIKGSLMVLSGIIKGNYVYSLDGWAESGEASVGIQEKESLAHVWHKRLGHISKAGLHELEKRATVTASYLIKRSPSTALEKKTPMDLWSGYLANYEMLRIFGCVAYSHVNRGKLKPRAIKYIFLGVEPTVDPHTWENPKNEDEEQDEEPQQQNLDNYVLVHDRAKRTTSIPARYRDGGNVSLSRQSWSKVDDMAAYAFAIAGEEDTHELITFQEAINSFEKDEWVHAMKEEISSLKKNHTWELVDQPPGQKLVSCKWLYKIREGIKGISKPRVILSVTACEYYKLEQLDVKTAFLHGNLEETIYMRQPPSFEEEKSNKVCLLKKSFYALKQSPRQWYKRFDVYMISNGFSRSNYDSCEYFKEFAPGSLMYLMVCTRPDIAYAVSIVSRYLENPGLVYGRDQGNHVDVDGFVDADYAIDPDKGSSITGYVFMVHGCVVSWKATLQHVVALCTTKAEYMALRKAIKEHIWLKGPLIELGVNLRSVVVNCDNQSAIHLSKNAMFHERTKHINVRYHFIREIVEYKEIKVAKIGTKNIASDAFTKVVLCLKFKYCMEMLGVGIN